MSIPPNDANPRPRTSRRTLLKASSAAAAFSIVPRHVLGGPKFVAPSDIINVALIGCGGRSRQNLKGIQNHSDARVIAVADPAETSDATKLKIYRKISGRNALKQLVDDHQQPKSPDMQCNPYEDFRVMLEKEPSIDAVVISTPDHQHAHGAVHCMKAGKHVYCEKPLTHNIAEARLVAKTAGETGVATQMGNQGHSRPTMAETVERVRSKQIGDIQEVHAWVPAKRWNPQLIAPPSEAHPIPDGLNWDLWLGPRAQRPFHRSIVPVHWRDYWDYGCGALGDFACHDLDSSVWSMNLPAPTAIHASVAGRTHEALAPHGSVCRFDFSVANRSQPLRITWYDGGLRPEFPDVARSAGSKLSRGVMFVGSQGVMLCEGAGGKCSVLMNDGSEAPPASKPSIRRVTDHYRDWLDACKGGEPALSNFEYGARLTEITLLGVLAVRTGERIDWDAENMVAKGHDHFNDLIRGTYRTGWEITG